MISIRIIRTAKTAKTRIPTRKDRLSALLLTGPSDIGSPPAGLCPEIFLYYPMPGIRTIFTDSVRFQRKKAVRQVRSFHPCHPHKW